MYTDISVIIVNWNGEEVIKECLDSVYNSNYDKNKIEIIVVDNNSKDKSIGIIKDNFPEIILIEENDNHGFAEGNNIGFRIAKGEYIAMLNNDLVIDPNWFDECVKALKEPAVAAVCGKVYEWNDDNPKLNKNNIISTTILKINNWTGLATNFNHESPDTYDMDYLAGAAMMFKKSIADKIGFLDKEYFAYYEETDFCARMIKAGYKLKYLSMALSWHRVMHSTKKTQNFSEFNMKMMARNRIRYMRKNANPLQKLFFYSFLILELLRLNYFTHLKYRKFPEEKKFYKFKKQYLLEGIIYNLKTGK